MADNRIAGLNAITEINTALDFIPIVDVSDPQMAISGTTKKITINQILAAGTNVVIPAGTAGSPSISFSGDSNTGIYAPAADQLSISSGGSGNATVSSTGLSVTGSVSATSTITGTQLISTLATGTAPLSINSTTLVSNLNADLLDGQHGSYYQNADNINAGTLAVTRGGTGASTFTAGRVLFGNGTSALNTSANLFWDNSNNRLGVVAATPAASLQVGTRSSSTLANNSTIFTAGGASASAGTTVAATFANTVAAAVGNEAQITFTPASNYSATGAIGTAITSTTNGESALKFYTYNDSVAGLTERLRIDSTGNVGIGTAAPTTRLDVVGAGKISGSLSVQGADVFSPVRAAASDYAGVAFDGATSGTRVISTLTGQAIGTGDFSVWCRFKVTSSIQKAVFSLIEDGPNYFGVVSGSAVGNNWSLSKSIGGVDTTTGISGFTSSAFSGQVVDFVLVRSAGVFSVFVNGTQYTLTNTTGNISLSAAANLRVGGYFTASQVYDQPVYRTAIFNRALSSADIADLIANGINPADQWGTQTQIVNTTTLNGGFETAGAGGADVFANWVEYTTGTATITRDTVDYSPDLGSTASAKYVGTDGTAVFSLYNASTGTLLAGKRYRISAAHKRSANANIAWRTTTGNVALVTFAITTSWANYVGEFVMPTNDSIKIDGSGAVSFWTDNVILERIGAIVDLDLTIGLGDQAYDRSTNNLHGVLTGGVSWTVPKDEPVPFIDGTAALPAITNAGDTNTGFYFPAADAIAATTNSTERLRIASDGVCTWSNVGGGSGTAMTLNGTGLGVGVSPSYKLDVSSASNIAARISSSSNLNTGLNIVNTTASTWSLYSFGSNDASLANSFGIYHQSGTLGLQITSSGNVGIGTATPSVKVQVDNNGQSEVRIRNTSGSGIAALALVAGAQQSNPWYIYADSSRNLIFQDGGSDRGRIDSSGNLGLGVTPSSWDATFRSISVGINSASAFMASEGATTYIGDEGYYNAGWKHSYAGVAATLYKLSSGIHDWYSADSGATVGSAIAYTLRMRLTKDGNLGLGVTPSAWTLPAFQSTYGVYSGTSEFNTSANAFYDGQWKHINNAAATRYSHAAGVHYWFNKSAGTGVITWTQAMTLDASGNLLLNRASTIGTNSKLNVQLHGTSASTYSAPSNAAISVDAGTNDNCVIALVGGGDQGIYRANSSGAYDVGISLGSNAERRIQFTTAATTRLSIKSTGQVNFVGLASDPAGAAGDVYYNSTSNKLKFYDSAWKTIPASDQVSVANGTASAPSISFDSDTNTGIYRSGVDTLQITTGGVAAVRVNPNGSFGYTVSVGGAVEQATSRTTGVTLNKACGAITLVSAAGSTSWQTFTVTNNTVDATDVIRVCQKSGTDLYQIHVTNVANGSFKISFATTGGTTTEQPVFNFAVIKAGTGDPA